MVYRLIARDDSYLKNSRRFHWVKKKKKSQESSRLLFRTSVEKDNFSGKCSFIDLSTLSHHQMSACQAPYNDGIFLIVFPMG